MLGGGWCWSRGEVYQLYGEDVLQQVNKVEMYFVEGNKLKLVDDGGFVG